jgi:hypothetical protein
VRVCASTLADAAAPIQRGVRDPWRPGALPVCAGWSVSGPVWLAMAEKISPKFAGRNPRSVMRASARLESLPDQPQQLVRPDRLAEESLRPGIGERVPRFVRLHGVTAPGR